MSKKTVSRKSHQAEVRRRVVSEAERDVLAAQVRVLEAAVRAQSAPAPQPSAATPAPAAPTARQQLAAIRANGNDWDRARWLADPTNLASLLAEIDTPTRSAA